MNISTNPLFGGIHLPPDHWSVVYDCIAGGASVEPDNCLEGWTKSASGSPTLSADNGMFYMATSVHTDGCLYTYDVAEFDTDEGALIEARLYVNSAAASADFGAVIGVEATENAVVAYIRAAGLNLDGQADVPFDLTGWHWIRAALQGDEVRLYVDDELVQSDYSASYATCNARALFGIIANEGPADLVWRYVRARRFQVGEVLGNSAP